MLLLASLSATQPSPCGGFHLGPEVRVNQDSSQGRQVECCVVKNPLTSKNIVVAAMDHRNDGSNALHPRVWAYATMDGAQVSASAGGSVPLPFQGGERYAGRGYRVLGTAGQEAGFLWGERWIPLDRDIFYDLVEARRNGPMFERFAGTLDGAGRAGAVFTVPPGGTFPVGTYHFVLVTEDGAYMSPIQTVRVVP